MERSGWILHNFVGCSLRVTVCLNFSLCLTLENSRMSHNQFLFQVFCFLHFASKLRLKCCNRNVTEYIWTLCKDREETDSSAGSYELTLSTLQLHVAICCSQPSVTQEDMYIWILRSFPNPLSFFGLSVCQPADLHPTAVPVHVRESS